MVKDGCCFSYYTNLDRRIEVTIDRMREADYYNVRSAQYGYSTPAD